MNSRNMSEQLVAVYKRIHQLVFHVCLECWIRTAKIPRPPRLDRASFEDTGAFNQRAQSSFIVRTTPLQDQQRCTANFVTLVIFRFFGHYVESKMALGTHSDHRMHLNIRHWLYCGLIFRSCCFQQSFCHLLSNSVKSRQLIALHIFVFILAFLNHLFYLVGG